MQNNAAPLDGLGVLVTRPADRAAPLCALIEQHGGDALAFPVIDIVAPPDVGAVRAAWQQLDEIDLLIFVSVHAVCGVTDALGERRLNLPARTRVAALGPKTAAQCEQASIAVDFVPRARINSEGLLEQLQRFEVAGKNILIFRGQSGRELIQQALQARGARVRCVASYCRKLAAPPLAPLLARLRKNQIHLAVVGSAAVMDALLELIGQRHRQLLAETPIFAYSQRVADYCRSCGLRGEIYAAEKPTDESIVDAIIKWAA